MTDATALTDAQTQTTMETTTEAMTAAPAELPTPADLANTPERPAQPEQPPAPANLEHVPGAPATPHILEKPPAPIAPQAELSTLTALLEQVRADTARQCDYAKKQLRLTRLFAGACALTLAVVVGACAVFVPRMRTMLGTVDDVMLQTQNVAANLETVSEQLADTDIAGMLQNVDALVLQSQTGITQALTDVQSAIAIVESFDIEALNASISDLHSIISPLASLLGK